MITSIKYQENISKIIKYVREHGIPTGSKLFGYEDYNDEDFIIKDTSIKKVMEYLNEEYDPMPYLSKEDEFGDKQYKFLDIKLRVNVTDKFTDIIIVREDEFNIWKTATNLMYNIITSSDYMFDKCKDKKNRVLLFEVLKNIVRN